MAGMLGMDSHREGPQGSRFWVTCYTDASFTPTAAGWAVWLRSARGRIVRHGACPPYVRSANEAEMAAIFAGVYLARRAWGASVRGLVVYTDSQAAIGFLGGEALRARIQRTAPGIARLRERIRTFSGDHGIELDLRWVKGHQPTNTVRAYLNARCDELAGAARAMAERDDGKSVVDEEPARKARGAIASRSTGTPNAEERATPGAADVRRRSRREKNRERRRRARERKRMKKAARARAPECSTVPADAGQRRGRPPRSGGVA